MSVMHKNFWKFLNREQEKVPKGTKETAGFLVNSRENVDGKELLGRWIYDNVQGFGVFLMDLKGTIKHCNAEAVAITSIPADVAKGKNLAAVFSSLRYDLPAQLGENKLIVTEVALADTKAKQKWLRVMIGPLADPLGGLTGFASVFQDITWQKEIQQKLQLHEDLRKARERVLIPDQADFFSDGSEFKELVGESLQIKNVRRLIQSVASTTTSILILGETGTGREAVARAVHFKSSRRDKPFVVVSCSATLEGLIEDELFGHVRGAFTDAVSDRLGSIKQADHGTIFLDEIGELPLHLQVKLFTVLEQKSVAPVGADRRTAIDVRVIAGSNIDLKREAEAGRFRRELLYRLNVVTVPLPPLRERREDVPVLTHYFINKFADVHKKRVEDITDEAMKCLISHTFPGNIWELENIVDHAIATTRKNLLVLEDLPLDIRGSDILEETELFGKTIPGDEIAILDKPVFLDDELATHEKCLLIAALKKANGVQKRAAEFLGINYRSFRHRLEKYGLLGRLGE
jgi:two-component system, NtrC family, response regulator PilR